MLPAAAIGWLLLRAAPVVVACGLALSALLVAIASWWALVTFVPTLAVAIVWDRIGAERPPHRNPLV
jgi:hypothetical protein